MKKKSRPILALLFLFLLSSLSFTLARYSQTVGYDITLVSGLSSTSSSETKNPEPSVDVTPKFISEGEFRVLPEGKKTVTIDSQGVYLIQLWGANGGPASYQEENSEMEVLVNPGVGGYVIAIGEFAAGDKLEIKVGQFGYVRKADYSNAGSGGTYNDIQSQGGMAGGGSSSVKIKRGSEELVEGMIAGGGGGSGPLQCMGYDGGDGGDVTVAVPIVEGTRYIYAGTDGKVGEPLKVGAKGGVAGNQPTDKGQDVATESGGGGGGGGGYRGGGAGENYGGGGGGSSMVDSAAGLAVGRADSALMKTLDGQVPNLPVAHINDRPAPLAGQKFFELYHGGYRLIKLEGSTYEEFKAAFE